MSPWTSGCSVVHRIAFRWYRALRPDRWTARAMREPAHHHKGSERGCARGRHASPVRDRATPRERPVAPTTDSVARACQRTGSARCHNCKPAMTATRPDQNDDHGAFGAPIAARPEPDPDEARPRAPPRSRQWSSWRRRARSRCSSVPSLAQGCHRIPKRPRLGSEAARRPRREPKGAARLGNHVPSFTSGVP